MKAIYCHGGSPHDKATPLAFTQFRPQKAEYQSFLLSYRLFLRGNILFLYWRIFYLIFSGNQNRRETMTSFHFDQSLNRLFSEFIHIFSTYFCKHFFCVFFHFISNIYCQLLLFHMLVNIMKNMNVIKKNYFYKYANLFWVK